MYLHLPEPEKQKVVIFVIILMSSQLTANAAIGYLDQLQK